MPYRLRLLWPTLALVLAACGGTDRAGSDLHAIFDDDWEWTLENFPTYGTFLGDPRYNDRLSDQSLEAIGVREAYARALLERLDKVDRGRLSPADQVNYDLFRQDTENDVAGQAFPTHLMPLNQMGGIQINLPSLQMVTPFRTLKDYEDYLDRLAAIPGLIGQTITLMQQGLETGWVVPKVPLRSVPDQIKAQLVQDATDSPFFKPFLDYPDQVTGEHQDRLTRAGRSIIAEQILPAYEGLLGFVTDQYIPAGREDVGAWALPDGQAYYAYRVKLMTTTDMTPDQIHQIGLEEVARIKAQMMKIVKATGFGSDFDAFTHFLRTDEQFYHDSPEALLMAYRDICKRLDAQLPKLFGKLPRAPYGVEEIPDYEAPASTTAYYRRPSADGSRPGTFFANTYNLSQRPTYEMEALSIHEAVPGHHLQIALAQEMEHMPKFRKFGGITAFVEGWGLYSESLGTEMGFYTDPYSKFGQLSYEMWRAVRLVVDTGMHQKKWTRQQAIDFFKANTGLTEHNIISEVDRYIVWPGQALAYKIGELKIKELRARASEELGDKFDIRQFHDVVLGQGALPLNLLEAQVTAWIEKAGLP